MCSSVEWKRKSIMLYIQCKERCGAEVERTTLYILCMRQCGRVGGSVQFFKLIKLLVMYDVTSTIKRGMND